MKAALRCGAAYEDTGLEGTPGGLERGGDINTQGGDSQS